MNPHINVAKLPSDMQKPAKYESSKSSMGWISNDTDNPVKLMNHVGEAEEPEFK